VEESGPVTSLRKYRGNFLEKIRKAKKRVSPDIRSLSRDLNMRPPEKEAEVLTTGPQILVN
jgi:hypothetical protein